MPANTSKKLSAIFLDRDGVINYETEYCHKIEDFRFIAGVMDFLRFANSIADHVFIVTNQAGIAKAYFSEQQYQALTTYMLSALTAEGIKISKVYYCPHHPEGTGEYQRACSCRKPNPGMILSALKEFDVRAEHAILIGDKISDVLAGKKANLSMNFLVETGHAISESDKLLADKCFVNLGDIKEFLSQ